ncbi:hypothetical protein KJ359_010102 [Pestalotiopsis sp. 9143b]|nr:hypothetical protein KJ359_010102 [Pestalotiopsis sp. 9143b]
MYRYIAAFDELGDVPPVQEQAKGNNAGGRYFVPSAIDPNTMTRASTLYAYYDKVSSRSNLKLLLMHQVREILFDNDTKGDLIASGVKALNRETNETISFTASKEVILAAGAVYTPQLLQWSGIGPKSILESSGIATKLDLPAVGSNFQDHATAYYSWNRECKTFRIQ